jgi:hypothetical protein
MNVQPLELAKPYHVKHTTQIVGATFRSVEHRVDVNSLEREPASTLTLNEIGRVTIETTRPLFYDAYTKNRATGAFIVIDPISNATLGAGMLLERAPGTARQASTELLQFEAGRLTPAERYSRSGHLPATVWLTARADLAWLVERRLFDRGCQVQALADDTETTVLPDVARILNNTGMIVICSTASDDPAGHARARSVIGDARFVDFAPDALPATDDEAASVILRRLEDRGILRKEDFSAGEGI